MTAMGNYWFEAVSCETAGAYLASCIMLAATIEGQLVICVSILPEEAEAALTRLQESGEIKKDLKVRKVLEWHLGELVSVAEEAKWLPSRLDRLSFPRPSPDGNTSNSLSLDLIRKFRNLVHPGRLVRKRNGQAVTKGELELLHDTCVSVSWHLAQKLNPEMNVSTYNLTTVQSIAVILYCAGRNRFCNSNGTFMMHPVALPIAAGQYNAKHFQDQADTCNRNTHAISQIVANVSHKNEPDVFEDMNRTIWLNAQEAVQYGLVTTVSDLSMTGRQYVIVEEDGSVRNPDQTASLPLPLPNIPSLPISTQLRSPGAN